MSAFRIDVPSSPLLHGRFMVDFHAFRQRLSPELWSYQERMTFLEFDTLRAAHLLARVQSEPTMRADVLFERRYERGLSWAAPGATTRSLQPPSWWRREQGFAVRLRNGDRTWQESRDRLDGPTFDGALRRVARSLSSIPLPSLAIESAPWNHPEFPLLQLIPSAVEKAVREQRAAFPFSLELSLFARELVVAGPAILSEPQSEHFLAYRASVEGLDVGGLFSFSRDEVEAPSGPAAVARISHQIAADLVNRFRGRAAPSPKSGSHDIVLSPQAAAVFLHEAVAHALEADILSNSGSLSSAVGVALGSPLLDIVEDPSGAPFSVRRTHDDEGTPTASRWLLREGKVCQPIADIEWSERASLDPGCGRCASRHDLIQPRTSFLRLLPGSASASTLLEGKGLWVDRIQRGALQPITGEVTLVVGSGRQFENGVLGERRQSFEIRGSLAELLTGVVAVGNDSMEGGAGWCAKGAQKLPVWANTPSLRIEGATVS